MSDLADQIREIAELRMYDGNTDQPLEGYMEALCLADEVDALVAKLAEVERERDGWRQHAEDEQDEAGRQARRADEAELRFDAAEARIEAVKAIRDELARDVPAVEQSEALATAAWSRTIAERLTAVLHVPAGTAQPDEEQP